MTKIIKKSQICCVVITYNPDDILIRLINIIKRQVGKIIIVDNNSTGNGSLIVSQLFKNEKLYLIRNKENAGIAKALNQGIELAKEMKFDWVITFDQDTKPFNDIIETICEIYALYPNKNEIGAIGVNYLKSNSKALYQVSKYKKYHIKDYLITSGCLLSVNNFIKFGGFREDLFIDNVDIEYSLRLRKFNKICLIANKLGMYHKVGTPDKKRLFGLNLVSSNHNCFRRYYMARNHIIISQEYFLSNFYFIAKANYFFLLSLLQILLVEKNKKIKFSASVKGIIDGIIYSNRFRKQD